VKERALSSPLVSVIIPAFNQAEFVGEAIQSVLDQTYSKLEVIVVNDASLDHTSEVVKQYNDARVTLIEHRENRGLPAARNTGIRASTGEIIALLDADDLFHPEKLQAHVGFLGGHPDVGVTYNARFELNHSANTIRELWRPPLAVGLVDLVLGFPFSPSDMLLRREWAFDVGLFDESFVCGGEDTDLPCRLALAGCQFASVNRALNYRRYHSGRRRKNLPCRLDDVARSLRATFSDPRCPDEVLALRDIAMKHHLIVLVSLAFMQEETDLGQEYVRELVQIDPSILQGKPCELVDFLLRESISDESLDHQVLLKNILAQLPLELAWLDAQYNWAVAHGYLLKGTRAIIWGRSDVGKANLERAATLGIHFDEGFLQEVTHQLLSYEIEFGPQATQMVIRDLAPYLNKINRGNGSCRLKSSYWVNRAFQSYHAGRFDQVPGQVLQAVASSPKYLGNRGVLAILLRSLMSQRGYSKDTGSVP
jgi:glycosyltransferase involved in cell wall biosynthesis